MDEAHSARAIVASLRIGEPSAAEVFDAFWQLDALPLDDVRDAIASWIGPLPDPERLDPATRLAHGWPPPPLRLRTLSVEKDADILDLGPVAEEQLRLAGKSWDGADLAPEERLDGEVEGSFAGSLERRVLADKDAPGETPLFDVLLFGEDSGVVFAAGTTTMVALIAYGKVELRDRRARIAIEEALAAPGAPSSVEDVPPPSLIAVAAEKASGTPSNVRPIAGETTRARKTVPKKTTAKKTTAKKTTAKKTVAKKATKSGPKKTTTPRSARKAAVKTTKRTSARSTKVR